MRRSFACLEQGGYGVRLLFVGHEKDGFLTVLSGIKAAVFGIVLLPPQVKLLTF